MSAYAGSSCPPAAGRRRRTSTGERRRSSTCSSGRGLSWQAGEVSRDPRRATASCTWPAPARTRCMRSSRSTCSRSASASKTRTSASRGLGMSYVGSRLVGSLPGSIDGLATQFVLESELGPPPLPEGEPAPRPPTIVNVEDVEAVTVERPRVVRTRRNLGRAAGSVTTGIQHVEVAPGKESAPAHCHSLEEEIFVILDGDGVLVLCGQRRRAVRARRRGDAGPCGSRDLAAGGDRGRAHVPGRRLRAHLSRLRDAPLRRRLLLPALGQDRVPWAGAGRRGWSGSTTGTARVDHVGDVGHADAPAGDRQLPPHLLQPVRDI